MSWKYDRTWLKQPWLSLGRFGVTESKEKHSLLKLVFWKTSCHIADIEYTEHI